MNELRKSLLDLEKGSINFYGKRDVNCLDIYRFNTDIWIDYMSDEDCNDESIVNRSIVEHEAFIDIEEFINNYDGVKFEKVDLSPEDDLYADYHLHVYRQ